MIAHVSSPIEPSEASAPLPERCVIVVDAALPPGLAANAAAVLALTLGARVPALPGPDYRDAAGATHPGLIPIGLPVLAADAAKLARIREQALARGLEVAGFPAAGQTTTDYAEFTATVAVTATEELAWLGLALWGERRAVSRVTGSLGLLR
jgi:hypothetical protein